jgi:hypothetical protein
MWHEVAIVPKGYAQPPPIAERRCVLYERNSSIAGGHNKTMKSKGVQVTIVSAQQLRYTRFLTTGGAACPRSPWRAATVNARINRALTHRANSPG